MTQPRTFIAYLRVSTAKQGHSGLGLEAQQAAIDAFLGPQDRVLAPPFIEVESGKKAARPKLAEALAKCRKTGATLLVAKLDRLSRNVAFISNLMESGVEFVALDMPSATKLTLHILAAVAEEETRMISQRTKGALAASKARGTKLGGDRGYRPTQGPDWKAGVRAAAQKRAQQADHTAHRLVAVIGEVRASLGAAGSLNAIAKALSDQGVPTPRGGALWTATGVKRVLARVEVAA